MTQTFFLDEDEKSLERCFEILNDFAICSGLKVNVEKTEVVWIGSKQGSREKLAEDLDLKWNFEGKFTNLGITFETLANDITYSNFQKQKEKIIKLLSDWSLRNLSIIGKITVIKSLAISHPNGTT